MLQSLEIENFRQFSHFTIPKLGRINLLTGKNNSGKTSVLEAIYLLMTQEHPAQSIVNLHINRGEVSPLGNSGEYVIGNSREYIAEITHLFHNRNVNNGEVIRIWGLHQEGTKESISIQIDTSQKGGLKLHSLSDIRKETWPKLLLEKQNQNSGLLSYSVDISPDFKIPFDRSLYSQDSSSYDQDLEFLVSTDLDSGKVAKLFDEIVLTSKEDLVIEAIQIIEPNIKRIAPDHGKFERVNLSSRQGFLVQLRDEHDRTPMGSMGDGIWRLLGIALTMVNAKGQVLLIDEIDAGFHYSVMIDLWKFIWKSAKELDIQVFATTHSGDCWEALGELIEAEEIYDDEVMIHRIDAKHDHSVSYDTDKIVIAAEDQVEVR